jgi:hypothetical protein
MGRFRQFGMLVVFAAAIPVNAEAQSLPCPALSSLGERLPLTPSAHGAVDISAFASEHAPEGMADKARSIVSLFETGRPDGYASISTLDTLSIGISQWNHGTGSMYTVLFKRIPSSAFNAAPANIRVDLIRLRDDPKSRQATLKSWTTGRADDPLVSGVRKSIWNSLSSWLNSASVVQAQKELTNKDMDFAIRHSRAWLRDSGRPGMPSVRLLTNFYDFKVYNGGGFAGVWVEHVRVLRQQYPTPLELITHIEEWSDKCVSFRSEGTKIRKLYGADNLAVSVDLWKERAKSHPEEFTDDVLDMLAFGLLRAQRSTGNDAPRGFPGVFQADVMMRRGVEAVGTGYRGRPISALYDD